MEDIDIETLDFDIYNREIYKEEENNKKSAKYEINKSNQSDAYKRYKKEVEDWAKEYNKKNKIYQKNEVTKGFLNKKYKY